MEAVESALRRGFQAMLARRRELQASGAAGVGWKAAFGSPQAQRRLGLPHLLVGFLTDRSVLPSGSTVRLEGWHRPVAEPEVAVRLRAPVLPGTSGEAVAQAVGGLAPAIELVDVQRQPEEDLETVLAVNIFHRYAAVGEIRAVEFRGSLAGIVGRVFRNGVQSLQVQDLEHLPGRVVDVLSEMARVLAGLGEALGPGDLVICGSVVPPLPLEGFDRSVGFLLEGFGEVTVHLQPRGR